MSDVEQEHEALSDEYIWLRLFFSGLDVDHWYEIARLLLPHGPRLHFHALLPDEAADEIDPGNTRMFARHYPPADLMAFERFIRQEAGQARVHFDTDMALVARLMMLCNHRTAYQRLRRELYRQFPDIRPRSGQLIGMICNNSGDLFGLVS